MFNVSKSYAPEVSNGHCWALDRVVDQPCWGMTGMTRVTGNWAYSCRGHIDGYGYYSTYIKERTISRFDSLPENVDSFIGSYEIKSWPQLYRYDTVECEIEPICRLHRELGYIISGLRKKLTKRWKHVVVDTKLTMLMPGWYPCIPGWHCDDFDRTEGQPNLINAQPAEHVMVVFGDCSLTTFINEPIDLEVPEIKDLGGKNMYGILHNKIEAIKPKTVQVKSGEIWKFNERSWHRGEPATKQGWRYFIRLTGSNHREPKNEIRTQSNVYLTNPFEGW